MDRRAGRPLIALTVVLIAWIAMRGALWESPFGIAVEPASIFARDGRSAPSFERRREPHPFNFGKLGGGGGIGSTGFFQSDAMDSNVRQQPIAAFAEHPAVAPPFGTSVNAPSIKPGPSLFDRNGAEADVRVLRDQLVPSSESPSPIGRWSLDGWVFLRQGTGTAAVTGPAPANYGASQAGAVLRYRLDPGSRHRPNAYMRATTALAGVTQADLAAGLSVRPLPALPVSLLAEARVSHSDGKTELRPAVLAVTQLPPVKLPLALRGEAYGQAGYVGGTFATGFVDGQARVDREVARFDDGTLAVGAGAWGGAQEGAGRLDIGPTIRTDLVIADTPMRLSVDYRHRVAGGAAPASGLAMTVSAGF